MRLKVSRGLETIFCVRYTKSGHIVVSIGESGSVMMVHHIRMSLVSNIHGVPYLASTLSYLPRKVN